MNTWEEIGEEISLFSWDVDIEVKEPNISVGDDTFQIDDPEGLLEEIKNLSDRATVDDLLDLLS